MGNSASTTPSSPAVSRYLRNILQWPLADRVLLLSTIPFTIAALQTFAAKIYIAQVGAKEHLSATLGVGFGLAVTSAWAILLITALAVRKRTPQSRVLLHAITHLYALTLAGAMAINPPFSAPPWLGLIGGAAVGLLFLEPIAVRGAIVTWFLAFAAGHAAVGYGLLPFESLPTPSFPPKVPQDIAWLARQAVLSIVFSGVVIGLMDYAVTGWRARERDLAAANANLRQAEEELQRANQSLERRVRERTQELSQTNAELEAEMHRRQDLEEQLRQSAKMEAVGRLTGGIAHDFNNLLTVIDGYVSLLQIKAEPGTREFEDFRNITQNTRRAKDLVRQLLAFSRKQVIQPRPLDLNQIVETTREVLSPAIGEGIELRLSLAPGLGAVRADPGQIEQMILNLAFNAKDAMPTGGALFLETANIDLDADYARRHPGARAGPHVLLTLRDTGVGMDAETIKKIFDPFFTTKDVGKGTGLGLSTVYGIVQQSGGHIEVESRVGEGTAFHIYFPRVDAAPEPRRPSGKNDAPLPGTETILVVEDEPMLLDLIRQVLEEFGYRILTAGAAEDAIRLAQEHDGHIALLLTDVVMPRMNGRELAGRLAPLRPQMKVLYMSGHTEDAIIVRDIRRVRAHFLPKPFQPHDLGRKVREVLDFGEAPVAE